LSRSSKLDDTEREASLSPDLPVYCGKSVMDEEIFVWGLAILPGRA